jgi:hypothetical protein
MGYSFDSLKNKAGSEDLLPYGRSVKRLGYAFVTFAFLLLLFIGYVHDRGLLSGPKGFIMGHYIFPVTNKINFPKVKRWIVEKLPSRLVQDMKDVVDTIEETAIEICEAKKRDIEKGGDGGKKDVISILSEWPPEYCCLGRRA